MLKRRNILFVAFEGRAPPPPDLSLAGGVLSLYVITSQSFCHVFRVADFRYVAPRLAVIAAIVRRAGSPRQA